MRRKWKLNEWKAWLQAQPGLDSAMKVVIGIILVILLIGVVAAAFRFLWSAIVLVALIGLALFAAGKLRQQGVKVPIGFADYRNRKGRPERSDTRRRRPH